LFHTLPLYGFLRGSCAKIQLVSDAAVVTVIGGSSDDDDDDEDDGEDERAVA